MKCAIEIDRPWKISFFKHLLKEAGFAFVNTGMIVKADPDSYKPDVLILQIEYQTGELQRLGQVLLTAENEAVRESNEYSRMFEKS